MHENFSKIIKTLQKENQLLKRRINELEAQLGIDGSTSVFIEPLPNQTSMINFLSKQNSTDKADVLNERLDLFSSYFRGRSDVYAKKSINKEGKKSYYPQVKKQYKVWNPKTNRYDISAPADVRIHEPLTRSVLESHLNKTVENSSIGLYPMIDGDKCYLCAIDFDGASWIDDIKAVIDQCKIYGISFLPERSQSGNGGHLWFFFTDAISAYKARRLATVLLSLAMKNQSTLSLGSYDRIFPSQDFLSKDGIGNLIALPLNGQARNYANSIFLDDSLEPIPDDKQWEALSNTTKITEDFVDLFLAKFESGFEYQNMRDSHIPQQNIFSNQDDDLVPQNHVDVFISDSVSLSLDSLTTPTLDALRRIASFKNPEYFKKQKMRMSTWNVPRIICSAERIDNTLVLPRNCLKDIEAYFTHNNIPYYINDNRFIGTSIDVLFNGTLNDRQNEAFGKTVDHDFGVISAPTGFGKTVLGASLISHFKVNTLVIVPNKVLLYQWQKALNTFITKDFEIGLLGDGKSSIDNKIDIAIVNSLEKHTELCKHYGLVIVDECHHAASLRYESVLKRITAKRLYGLSATPIRNNGQQELIFMQCGDIVYELSHKESYQEKSFTGWVIPKLTSYRSKIANKTIHDLYDDLHKSESRNKSIVKTIREYSVKGNSILVLSNRINHLDTLASMLDELDIRYLLITGALSSKKRKMVQTLITDSKNNNEPVLILSTGQYIGEGFDFPALDTLILASPISWKGNIIQYVGRVNREHENKNEVHIIDFVDFKVPVLMRMHSKRLSAYRKIGYEIVPLDTSGSPQLIYNEESYWPMLEKDFSEKPEHVIVSASYLSLIKTKTIIESLIRYAPQCKVEIYTSHDESNMNKDLIKYLENKHVKLIYLDSEVINFLLIDLDIIWYGSLNPFGNTFADDSILRLEGSGYHSDFLELLNDG